jgi:hypothetical protein
MSFMAVQAGEDVIVSVMVIGIFRVRRHPPWRFEIPIPPPWMKVEYKFTMYGYPCIIWTCQFVPPIDATPPVYAFFRVAIQTKCGIIRVFRSYMVRGPARLVAIVANALIIRWPVGTPGGVHRLPSIISPEIPRRAGMLAGPS